VGPCKFTLTGHASGGAVKGDVELYTVPKFVADSEFVLESYNNDPESPAKSKSCVPEIAVKGDVEGVKF